MSNLIISLCNDSFSHYLISGMDPDIEERFDLSNPLEIQENEKNTSEYNDKINPTTADFIPKFKDYKHPLDYCDMDEFWLCSSAPMVTFVLSVGLP